MPRKVLDKEFNDLTFEDVKTIVEKLNNLYEEVKNNSYNVTDIELDFYKHSEAASLKAQELIEGNVKLDMEKRIVMFDDLANILRFLLSIKDLDDDIYEKYKDDIYFEFQLIIGRHYVVRLKKYLDSYYAKLKSPL